MSQEMVNRLANAAVIERVVPLIGRIDVANSTEREFYNPIPECAVMVEVARRVSNTRDYGAALKKRHQARVYLGHPKAKKNKFFEKYEKDFLAKPQPVRTDLEFVVDGKDFVDIKIPPG